MLYIKYFIPKMKGANMLLMMRRTIPVPIPARKAGPVEMATSTKKSRIASL